MAAATPSGVAPPTATKCERTPGGFYWREGDVPETLKQSVPLCWTYVAGVEARPTVSRVPLDSSVLERLLALRSADPKVFEDMRAPSALPEEALAPQASRKRR
jgi:hypothetical protein